MALPDINLDDRSFPELVAEARRRIAQSCPEWTDHNVSDPGITLIEMFAWMTDMLVYRVNRIPEKLHLRLLDLMGLRLWPPAAAVAPVTFRLSAPPAEPVVIAGDTPVATAHGTGGSPVVFETDRAASIPVVAASRYVLRRSGRLTGLPVVNGVATAAPGGDAEVFSARPRLDDAFHLGFDVPLDRLVIRVQLTVQAATAAGVDPRDPPVTWEISTGEGRWEPAEVLVDTTGALTTRSGLVDLHIPEGHRPTRLSTAGDDETPVHWVRCRVSRAADTDQPGLYGHSPRVTRIGAAAVGVTVEASHRERVLGEEIGISDGTRGQTFTLRRVPVLEPSPDEALEVLRPASSDADGAVAAQPTWERWERVSDFAPHGPDARVYRLEPATGEIDFGPSIREPDGRWRLLGDVPPAGSRLRFTSYRHGGGQHGNVAAGALGVLRTAVPGVTAVENRVPARGGVDRESLESARHRAALLFRARDRAVTADDVEALALEAGRGRIARAHCVPLPGGAGYRVLLVPAVPDTRRRLTREELDVPDDLLRAVAEHLDARRIVGTVVQVATCAYRPAFTAVAVEPVRGADPATVENAVLAALFGYINPVGGGGLDPTGSGWPWGRDLTFGELYGVVYSVPGVQLVRFLRLYACDLTDDRPPADAEAVTAISLAPDELVASGPHSVRVLAGEG